MKLMSFKSRTAWRPYTAKDYVQGGLVAMWDSIENVGFGLHDGAATVWKDLVGGRVMEFSQGPKASEMTVQFGENYLDLAGAMGAIADTAQNSELMAYAAGNPATIECACTKSDVASRAYLFTIWQNITYSLYTDPPVFGLERCEFSDNRVKLNETEKALSFIGSPGVCTVYANGDLVTTKTANVSSTTKYNSNYRIIGHAYSASDFSYYGRIRYLRIYNRALTPAEIAANYAIDCARFKIGGAE